MYKTILCSTGNPDHGQFVAPSPMQVVQVNSLNAAVVACRKYIDSWNLGGGNWCGDAGKVFRSGKFVATISYNGKVITAE